MVVVMRYSECVTGIALSTTPRWVSPPGLNERGINHPAEAKDARLSARWQMIMVSYHGIPKRHAMVKCRILEMRPKNKVTGRSRVDREETAMSFIFASERAPDIVIYNVPDVGSLLVLSLPCPCPAQSPSQTWASLASHGSWHMDLICPFSPQP